MKLKITILFSLIFSLASLSYSCAQGDKKRDNKKSVVSKRQDTIPAPLGRISDFEKVFSPAQVEALKKIVMDFDVATGIEIAIVTVDTGMVTSDKFESFILALGNEWHIGKKNEDKGMVIGFSRGHRKIRILNGYGIEKMISDKETKTIMETNILVHFKKDDYYGGTVEGVNAIIALLNEKLNKSR